MSELIMAVALLCGPQINQSNEANADYTAAVKSCQSGLLTCAYSGKKVSLAENLADYVKEKK